jgi:hypothetical protein
LSYRMSPNFPCTGPPNTGSTTVTPPIQITGSGFSFSGRSGGFLFDMTGMFSSGTTASGTIGIGVAAPPASGLCSEGGGGAWNATRGQ